MMITIRELYIEGMNILKEHGILEPDIDARYLLLHCLDISSSQYYLMMNNEVSESNAELYKKCIEKRSTHYPLQYIIGKQEFMGLDFFVNEDVLIPRQDTEILVEKVLDEIGKIISCRKNQGGKINIRVLDMCTGSGCIAISIDKIANEKYSKYANIEVDAVDISKKALNIAEKNVLINNVRVNLVQSDLFDNVNNKYDIIVSNPPYIRSDVIETLMEDVREYEPRLALDGDSDGLCFYKKIIENASSYMKEKSKIMFEIGYDQALEVSELLEKCSYKNIEVIKDLAGLDRVVNAEI